MKYFYSLSLVLVAFVMIGAGCTETEMAEQVQPEEEIIIQEDIMTYSFPGVLSADQIEGKIVRISTEKGDITAIAAKAAKTTTPEAKEMR